jgi:hypothetical protein
MRKIETDLEVTTGKLIKMVDKRLEVLKKKTDESMAALEKRLEDEVKMFI